MTGAGQVFGVVTTATVCYEANRAFCATLPEHEVPPAWDDAQPWQRETVLKGVMAILGGEVATPEQSHESWSAEKERTGWCWGPVKDVDRKQHPCLVPYHELPPEQKVKDALFLGVAMALLFGRYATHEPVFPGSMESGRVELVPDAPVVLLPAARIDRLRELADGIQQREHGLASEIRRLISPPTPSTPE